MSGFQLLFWSSIVVFMALIFKFYSVIFCFLQSDFSSEDEKMGNKPKLKRGIFGKSTKRKSNSRPSSEFIACEMTTMSEEDRINLMRSVKNGEMSVEQALKRFVRYETIFFKNIKRFNSSISFKGACGFFYMCTAFTLGTYIHGILHLNFEFTTQQLFDCQLQQRAKRLTSKKNEWHFYADWCEHGKCWPKFLKVT